MAVQYHQGRFPPNAIDWPRLLPLIGPANAAVARYEGVLHGIPNPNVLLSPLTAQEAVLSSSIEGTQATLGEVLEFEAQGELFDESTPKKADIREVLNYRAALHEATRLLEELPLSQRLVRQTHHVLMQGVRGRNKDPGEYRRIANWIGPAGCSLEQARFVPVGAEALPEAMNSWERYLHADAPDRLVQLAVLHAEFEAIHRLYGDRKDWIAEVTRSQYAVRALDWIFSRPIFKTSDFVASVDIPAPTAKRILRVVRDHNLLTELQPASGRRSAILAFSELLDIADRRGAF